MRHMETTRFYIAVIHKPSRLQIGRMVIPDILANTALIIVVQNHKDNVRPCPTISNILRERLLEVIQPATARCHACDFHSMPFQGNMVNKTDIERLSFYEPPIDDVK